MPEEVELDTAAEEVSASCPAVMIKYNTAGEIANSVFKKVITKCVAGASVKEICSSGDQLILEETSKVFKKNKKIKKGIAFPTCVSTNSCLCNSSFVTSTDDVILKDGDCVKIDLGAHIDGFVGCAAHTLIVGATEENPTTGVLADMLYTGHVASELLLRLFHKSAKAVDITSKFNKLVSSFGFKVVDEIASNRVSKYDVESDKKIYFHESEMNSKSNSLYEVEEYEAYCINFFLTNAESCKPRDLGTKTTVYRMSKENYSLKMNSSRELIRQVSSKFVNLPFSIRNLENESKARLGVKECLEHGVLIPHTIYHLKDNDLCVQFKFTIVITPNGVIRTTHDLWDEKLIKTELQVTDPDLLSILKQPIKKKANKTSSENNKMV